MRGFTVSVHGDEWEEDEDADAEADEAADGWG